jgi:hypothetical protein
MIYFSASGVVGTLWAIAIFHAQRKLRSGRRGEMPGMFLCSAAIAVAAGTALRGTGMSREAE